MVCAPPISDIEPVRADPACEPPAVLPVEPALPVEPVALPPAVELPVALPPAAEPVLDEPVVDEPPMLELLDPPARLCSVPRTSTFLPTSDVKFEALPVR
jgi:hypothetical protein